MGVSSYKDLVVWQRSIELVEEIYILTNTLPPEEKYGLVIQMRRAAVSTPSNIAEGFRRKTTADFSHFLRIADGSASELETQLIVAKRLYPNIDSHKAGVLLLEVQKMLGGMMSKMPRRA